MHDIDTIQNIDYMHEITIAFINYFEQNLNEKQIKHIQEFENKYDVCILNDGNLTYANLIIKRLFENK